VGVRGYGAGKRAVSGREVIAPAPLSDGEVLLKKRNEKYKHGIFRLCRRHSIEQTFLSKHLHKFLENATSSDRIMPAS
jgi:hypothetical protein